MTSTPLSPRDPTPTPRWNRPWNRTWYVEKLRGGWWQWRGWPWAVTAIFFVVYLTLEVRRHVEGLSTGYDLGIFTQVIDDYAHFSAPYVSLKGPHYNALGDHFHPILVVIAPFYRLFPTPVTLLVFQAALAALPVLPLMRWAREVRGHRFGWWVGLSYGLSWGVAELVWFDFHEVAFALPLLAFSLCALGQDRVVAAAWWAAPLVLVKEDLGATVAVVGLLIAWRGSRRLGLGLAAFGLVATLVEVMVIIPALNPGGDFVYYNASTTAHMSLLQQGLHAFVPWIKWMTVITLLAPTGFLAVRSPLVLVALPTLAWRFVSPDPHYWGTHYHYSGDLMPIVFAAAVHAVLVARPHRLVLSAACAVGVVVTGSTVASQTRPLHYLVDPVLWSDGAHLQAEKAVLQQIPDGVTVASSNQLAAQLVTRTDVSEVCPFARSIPQTVPPEYLVFDATDMTQPLCPAALQITAPTPHVEGYHLVARQDDVTLLQRD